MVGEPQGANGVMLGAGQCPEVSDSFSHLCSPAYLLLKTNHSPVITERSWEPDSYSKGLSNDT